MQFTSISFLAFAGLLLLIYYIVPKKLQWVILLIASYIFYLSAGLEYLFFIVFTTITTYIASRIIDSRLAKQKLYLAEHKEELSREEKKEYKDKRLSAELERICENRSMFTHGAGQDKISAVADGGNHYVKCAMPIISEGDIVGCVASLAPLDSDSLPESVETKLIQTAAGFLGRQLES